MNNKLVSIVKTQSEQLFKNIEFLFDYVDDQLLKKRLCKWPLWRQIYHMLHSMDQWFINPFSYADHRKDGFDIAALNTDYDIAPLRKDELVEYFQATKSKICDYLYNLDDLSLSGYPEGSLCPVSLVTVTVAR